MKRFVDFLILIVVLVTAGIAAYFFLLKDKEPATNSPAVYNPPAPTATQVPSISLPVMTENDLRALLPTSADMNGMVGITSEPEYYDDVVSDLASDAREVWPEFAERLETLGAIYGWDRMPGYHYDFCQRVSYPIGAIIVQVDQLASADLARQYINDPQVLGLLAALNTTYTASDTTHGWYTEYADEAGSCYDLEVKHALNFEYWGLFFYIEIQANQGVSRAELQPLFDQIVTVMVARVNALDAAAGLPATPVPPPGPIEPARVQFPITLDLLGEILPVDETMEQTGTLYLNHTVSRTYTLEQYVAAFHQLNMPEVADTLAQVGAHTGMVGQVARVWNARGACPAQLGVAFEFDFALFETAEGARGI